MLCVIENLVRKSACRRTEYTRLACENRLIAGTDKGGGKELWRHSGQGVDAKNQIHDGHVSIGANELNGIE
jgi:hypothetical protein